MANMSNYLEAQLIAHLFRDATYTKPTTLAIALSTSTLSDSSTGASMSEVANSNNYSRVQLDPDDLNWDAITGNNGTTSNLIAIEFDPASGSWGTISSIAIVDSATHGAGNVLFWGALAEAKPIGTGDTFTIDVGDLTVQIDN